jgi:hypothetical protein
MPEERTVITIFIVHPKGQLESIKDNVDYAFGNCPYPYDVEYRTEEVKK